MNAMEQRMLEAGYVRDPNNVNYRYPLLAFARREVAASGFTENCFLAED